MKGKEEIQVKMAKKMCMPSRNVLKETRYICKYK